MRGIWKFEFCNNVLRLTLLHSQSYISPFYFSPLARGAFCRIIMCPYRVHRCKQDKGFDRRECTKTYTTKANRKFDTVLRSI